MFKYKKKVLSDVKYQGIYLSDHLTVHNHSRLMECKKDPLVQAAWSTGGNIYYTTKMNPTQKKRL